MSPVMTDRRSRVGHVQARLVITALAVEGRSPAPEMTDARTHIPWVRASGMSCDFT
jgi:hypothetical protein